MRSPRNVVGSLLLLVALIGGACGDSGGNAQTDVQALAAASERTTEDGSLRFELAMDGGAAGETISMTGEGAFDMVAKLGRMTIKSAQFGGNSAEMIFTDKLIYMKLGDMLGGGDGAKPWLSLDPSTMPGGAGADMFGQLDPRDSLKALQAAVPSMRKVGTAKVRGESTEHFRGTVTLDDETIAKLPAAQQDALREARDKVGLKSYPMDVWIDGDGRVRRMTTAMKMVAEGQAIEMNMKMEFFGFGDKVSVEVPPADQVQDGAGILGGLQTNA